MVDYYNMNIFQSILLLIGRIAVSLMFFNEAYYKITHWLPTLHEMAYMGIPQTSIVLFAVCIINFFGALFLVLGFKTKWSAAALAILFVAVTFYTQKNFVNLLQHAAIFGGLLYIFVTGPGQFALDKK